MAEGGVGKCATGGKANPLRDYINKSQAEVADWVDLRHILKLCAKDMVYEVGGRFQEPWWQQAAVE